MLADRDRIFTNLYGFHSPGLQAAQMRGAWDGTKFLIEKGADPKALQEDERSTLLWEATSAEMWKGQTIVAESTGPPGIVVDNALPA